MPALSRKGGPSIGILESISPVPTTGGTVSESPVACHPGYASIGPISCRTTSWIRSGIFDAVEFRCIGGRYARLGALFSSMRVPLQWGRRSGQVCFCRQNDLQASKCSRLSLPLVHLLPASCCPHRAAKARPLRSTCQTISDPSTNATYSKIPAQQPRVHLALLRAAKLKHQPSHPMSFSILLLPPFKSTPQTVHNLHALGYTIQSTRFPNTTPSVGRPHDPNEA